MQTIVNQFNAMISANKMPVMEYEIAQGEFLLVNLDIAENGLIFSFDQDPLSTGKGLPIYFDGEIKNTGDCFLVPFDECFDHLDHYLQLIDQNINEGFIFPNNLMAA